MSQKGRGEGRSGWLVPAGLVALSLVPALAGIMRLAQVAGGVVTAENARFLASPRSITLHIGATTLYSVLGALQFAPSLRRRRHRWHRMMGMLLVPCGLLVATSGLWMTLTYPWAVGDGLAVYLERLVVGTLMLLSLVMGVDALRRRRWVEHGEWMIRAYAIALGAGTQVLTHLPWAILAEGRPHGAPRAVMMGAGWLINLVVAEWVIRRRTSTRFHDKAVGRMFSPGPAYGG
jgi:hypothetical protein